MIANPRTVIALRVASAVEFAAALGLWGTGRVPWGLAGIVATLTLVAFASTWEAP